MAGAHPVSIEEVGCAEVSVKLDGTDIRDHY
jgi:hypothetical protein